MKRLFDLVSVSVLLLALWPLLILLAFLVFVQLGSLLFFIQARPGLWGKPFKLYKFRTMTGARDAQQRLLPDMDRYRPHSAASCGTPASMSFRNYGMSSEAT